MPSSDVTVQKPDSGVDWLILNYSHKLAINYSKCEECLQSGGWGDSTFALCVKAFKEAVSNLGVN